MEADASNTGKQEAQKLNQARPDQIAAYRLESIPAPSLTLCKATLALFGFASAHEQKKKISHAWSAKWNLFTIFLGMSITFRDGSNDDN